jgi:hypothetical protein
MLAQSKTTNIAKQTCFIDCLIGYHMKSKLRADKEM